ncbi:class I SAM-dependent DNA methyltransferase [Amycolatopsis thermophila]|uniref:Ubiquinone/menaquinone biosynthesis C-methylase UbiE n=1 Tax=Amycolatopsis thermophila TaxID=206084 RepID=A0ABU0EWE6_9PSEU|nr:class I SAM-dependent methyltransferase [Amycolatopsis thermophila]MDQ0379640.1 ubiquinone/menaquinone biosynthesis C-methylase UbiE [Amycolatopsis thermophila]
MTYLDATRTAYDTVAVDYARLLEGLLEQTPEDLAMLGLFAEYVRRDGGQVADIGCGTGRVTTYLDSLGVPVFGIDLSPGMLAEARRRYPHLRFEVGAMADLALADESLGGILAWYSIIHTPPELLPAVFAEFARVLVPGGHLMVAFQAGDERRRLEQAYGHTVSYDAYRLPPDRIAELLADAGIPVTAQLVREPAFEYETTPQAYLLARRAR